jgi:hypothetical protein
MSQQILAGFALAAFLLVCFGVLLGATLTIQLLQPRLGQRAEERRQLNAEWAALHEAWVELERCPRCGYRFTERAS